MIIRPILLFFLLFTASTPLYAVQHWINVSDFGAKGDGTANDTEAVQSAVDLAFAQAGGTVYFPPGIYTTSTIVLKDNTTLYLDTGAVLRGLPDESLYPIHKPAFLSYTRNYVKRALLYAEGVQDICIAGNGVIDGNASQFSELRRIERPFVLRFVNCSLVRIQNIRFINSASWMMHMLACKDVYINGITVRNLQRGGSDGVDIDCCVNVRISDCDIFSNNDSLCFKSSGTAPCKNIVVSNCILRSFRHALKMGTESNGGFENIAISNCNIFKPEYENHAYGDGGIALMIVDGGTMKDITISNLTIKGVRNPLFIRLGDRGRMPSEDMEHPPVGQIDNITIRSITASDIGEYGCHITGIKDHPIRGLTLSDIRFTFPGLQDGSKLQKTVPTDDNSIYPEATMYDLLPSFGMYLEHVDTIAMNNVQLYTESNDPRPAIIGKSIDGMVMNQFGSNSEESPWISIEFSKNIRFSNFLSSNEVSSLIQMKDSHSIFLSNQ